MVMGKFKKELIRLFATNQRHIFFLAFNIGDKYNLITEISDKRDKKLRAKQGNQMMRHYKKLDAVR